MSLWSKTIQFDRAALGIPYANGEDRSEFSLASR